MKTERRHELETNRLADSLGRWGQKVQPYSRLMTGIALAVVVLIFAGVYVARQSQARSAAGWTEYQDLLAQMDARRLEPNKLSDLADEFPGKPVGEWSRLLLADYQLDQGSQGLFADKQEGRTLLRQALDNYQTVWSETRESLLREQALFGMARAHEALGTLDKARQEYQRLASDYPDSAFAAVSKSRAQDLEQPTIKQFYDWFAKYEPPSKMSSEPGTPGKKPPFTEPVIDESQFKLRQGFGDESSKSAPQDSPAAGNTQQGAAVDDDLLPPGMDDETGPEGEPVEKTVPAQPPAAGDQPSSPNSGNSN